MKKLLLSTLTALAILTTSSLQADAITDQLSEVIKMYEEKDYKATMDELKFITAEIQKLDAAENQKLLPAALEGWSVKAGDNGGQSMMGMMGGGTNMKATYKKGKERIEIQILANSPMISMMSMAISNPMLMSADPTTTPYRYKRNKGMKKKEGNNTEITLLLAGQIMLKLTGNNLENDATLEKYLDTIDLKKLKMSLL